MAVKVAINGFGRIGRLAFRQMFGAEGYEVVAINDLTSPKMLAHLLKYDSSQGKYALADTVSAGEDSITVDGKEIKIYAFPDANNCAWGELGVDVVLECSGFYTSKEKAQAHINAGARKVVISAPAGNDLPTIVYNVNHETLKAEDQIISAASCTTNCLAPMAKAGGYAAGLGHPNPHEDILKRYRELGGEIVTIGSDAHAPERIAADFDRACSILKKCGFRYHAIFRKRKPTFELI